MIITEKEFKSQIDQSGKKTYWKSEGYSNRWHYYKEAARITQALNPKAVLEAGTMGVRVFMGSDTINYNKRSAWKTNGKDTYWHDLAKIPYPITKKYDLFIAMRVMHRIEGETDIATVDHKAIFNEIRRICKSVLIAVPESWDWRIYTDIEPVVVETKRKKNKEKTCIYFWK